MSSRRSSCDESSVQGRLDPHVSLLDQVAEEDPDDADRHRDERGDLGDRPVVAHVEDLPSRFASTGLGGRRCRRSVASTGSSTCGAVRPPVSV